MFIDDTGDVDNAATNDPKRRYASITGVIFEWGYYHRTFDPSFRALKERHFGLTRKGRPPILHRHNLMAKQGPFQVLNDRERLEKWDREALSMYDRATFTVITTAVDKISFYYQNPRWLDDIYLMLVQNAVERFFYFLRANNGTGDVMAEALSDKHDKALKAKYRYVVERGTEHINAESIQRRLTSVEVKVKPKSDDISGLQIADLLAATSFHHCHELYGGGRGPIGFSRHIAGLLEAQKYYRRANGDPHGYGRVWRPQN